MPLLRPGDDFGKYQVVGLLGQGGMGVVYLALDMTLDRHVALKVLGGPAVHDPQFEARLRQEAKIIAQLEHPNIVQIHSLERIGNELAIDMAYVDGGPMSSVPVSVVSLVGIACEVLDALAWCHDLGIVHRDVKPNNILLSRQGRALLTDFGLAKLLGEQQTALQLSVASSCFFLGTPFYAPPESWDANCPTPAWDVYSVGMVLYERLSPVTPYTAGTPLSFLKQLSSVALQPLHEINEDVSEPLGLAISKMISHDVGQRPQNAREALELLASTPEGATPADAAMHAPIATRPTVRAAWIKRRYRLSSIVHFARKRVTRVAALVLVGLLLVAVAAFVTRQTDTATAAHPPERELRRASAISYDSVRPATREVRRASWMMKRAGTGEWDVLSAGRSDLWAMRARAQGDRDLEIEGHWAEYLDFGGLVFRHGTIAGTGTWLEPLRVLAVSLELTSTLDDTRSIETLVLTASSEQTTSQQFVRRIDSADFVPAIYYQELRSRAVDWIGGLEKGWFHDALPTLHIAGPSVTTGAIVLDGDFQDPEWAGLDSIAPSAGNAAATLAAVCTADAVTFGVRLPGTKRPADCDIGLLCNYDVHTGDSPRWFVRFVGGKPAACSYRSHGNEAPWECAWESANSANGSGWAAEVRVPYRTLHDVVAPAAGSVWRMVVTLRDANGAVLAQWGLGDATAPYSGVVLEFE